jgi:hypothetical protein
MKTHKTKTSRILTNFDKKLRKAIANDPYLNHTVRVRRHGYELEYKVTNFDTCNATLLYEGTIVSSSENSPFKVGDPFFLSANEIKSHIVLR